MVLSPEPGSWGGPDDSSASTAELPPRPDSRTGLPVPPAAPTWGAGIRPGEQDESREAPQPPAGKGPTLYWHRTSPREARRTGVVAFLVIVAGAAIIDAGRPWYTVWWIWLIPLLGAALITWMLGGETIAAGSDWLRYYSCVDLYRLTEISLRFHSTTLLLVLFDANGRATNIDLRILQGHTDIWALVHLGMRHSIVDRITAEVSPLALRILNLPPPHPTSEARAHHRELGRRRGQLPLNRWTRRIIGVVGALITGFGALVAAASRDAEPGGTVPALVFGVLVVVAGAAMLAWSIRRGRLLRRLS